MEFWNHQFIIGTQLYTFALINNESEICEESQKFYIDYVLNDLIIKPDCISAEKKWSNRIYYNSFDEALHEFEFVKRK